ncbi:hypothetical protein COBT_001715 [Conglomerata obtusa]
MNVENSIQQNKEKQFKIKQNKFNERIRDIIKDSCEKIFVFYNGEDFADNHLHVLFTVTKNLNYSEDDLNYLKITIETMFNEIEIDLKRAEHEKGLQNYYKDAYKKLKRAYEAEIVNISSDFEKFFICYDALFKKIYDKYKIEYVLEHLHLIDIAKDYKNMITICLYRYKTFLTMKELKFNF